MPPFSPLIGQPQAVNLLTQAIAKQRIAPAYLFAGPVGVGRRLAAECFIATLFGEALLAGKKAEILWHRIRDRNHPDLLWVEPTYLHQGKRLSAAEAIAAGIKRKTSPLIRLEQIREIGQFLSRPPLEASRAVVVVEQAETMAESPANALLKTLEEPGRATLILIAPGVESLLPTLVSRCQRIPFYRLGQEAMMQVLTQVGHEDMGQHSQILQLADGSPGAAIAHWEQLQALPPELLNQITQPPRSARDALALAREINQQIEPEVQLWLIDYLQYHYWQQTQHRSWDSSNLRPLQLLEKAREYLRSNVQPRLVWEVTLLGMVA
jgi:DNA polymerase-3 subunit delta'